MLLVSRLSTTMTHLNIYKIVAQISFIVVKSVEAITFSSLNSLTKSTYVFIAQKRLLLVSYASRSLVSKISKNTTVLQSSWSVYKS